MKHSRSSVLCASALLSCASAVSIASQKMLSCSADAAFAISRHLIIEHRQCPEGNDWSNGTLTWMLNESSDGDSPLPVLNGQQPDDLNHTALHGTAEPTAAGRRHLGELQTARCNTGPSLKTVSRARPAQTRQSAQAQSDTTVWPCLQLRRDERGEGLIFDFLVSRRSRGSRTPAMAKGIGRCQRSLSQVL